MVEAKFFKPQDNPAGSFESDPHSTISYGSFRLGDWIVERDLNRLRSANQCVKLTSLSMDILMYLARPPVRVVAAEELVRELWSGRVVSDNPVYKIIAKLRRALADDADQPRYIETVRKRGYRLVAPISDVKTVTGESPVKLASIRKTDEPARTLLVLPIREIGNHGDKACYCDGLAEEIRIQLGRVSDVFVVDSGSGRQEADLNVKAAVRMTSERVRVTVRLIRSTDGVQLWAKAYECRTGDGVESQISVAREVARAISRTQCSRLPSLES